MTGELDFRRPCEELARLTVSLDHPMIALALQDRQPLGRPSPVPHRPRAATAPRGPRGTRCTFMGSSPARMCVCTLMGWAAWTPRRSLFYFFEEGERRDSKCFEGTLFGFFGYRNRRPLPRFEVS